MSESDQITVTYFYSACVAIETKDIRLLCDPWFSEGAYDGSWYHFPKPIEPIERIGTVDYIYISHIHPDHYDPEFLKKYFEIYGEKPILIGDWKNNYLKNALVREGFNYKIINDDGLTIGNTKVEIIPHENGSLSDVDSLVIVKTLSGNANEKCVVRNKGAAEGSCIFTKVNGPS